VRKLFVIYLLVAAAALADETTYRSIQSGPTASGTPLYDHGIHGEGQIIAFLDTGVDYDSCYFAEADGSRPPINTRLDTNNVDLGRRKIVAYDFLYSCDQNPGAFGCDDPNDPKAYDNTSHGTLTAAAAVAQRDPFVFDRGDGDAPAAKAIVQDGGFVGGDNCSQRPGFGCPVDLTPILEQAYRQGARIHSNSWGDRQGTPAPFTPPLANYSAGARDIDAFVWTHPDMLVVFNTGNFSSPTGLPPPSSLSAPGDAKNTIQVGGTRDPSHTDDNFFSWLSALRATAGSNPISLLRRTRPWPTVTAMSPPIIVTSAFKPEHRTHLPPSPERRRSFGSTTPTASIRPAWPRSRIDLRRAPRC
jgi:hypothetical protein